MNKYNLLACAFLCAGLASCSDDEKGEDPIIPGEDGELPEWYYTGGQLATTHLSTFNAFEQPTEAIANQGLDESFKNGESFFEKPFMANNKGVRSGLGPVYIRKSCMHCHPGYGHGQRPVAGTYQTNFIGNGTLLVVYTPDDDKYVPWLSGMPQFYAVAPFKAPVDASKVTIEWKDWTDEWGNKFPDGETYSLQYPVVKMPKEAVYAVRQGYQIPKDYDVKIESTIGIFGTCLLDAITAEDLKAEYAKKEKDGILPNGVNPAIFKNGEWVSQYSNNKPSDNGNGKLYPRKFTYALSRGPLQDAAGVNALWNITNVTRSNRRYHYLDAAGSYVEYSAKDPEVQAGFDEYIAGVDPKKEHPTWWEGTMEERITAYLTSKELPVEMTDQEYTDFMVWHRGLAVPAARNVNDPEMLRGKEIFEQIGCTYCHRPSWTTGEDNIDDPNQFFDNNSNLPRYPHQKIWPYTDMMQHKLNMVNDVRTGWCRTTPLWARGLHQKCTGAVTSDRMHDCRARTAMEAIMWHGCQGSDARYSTEKFRKLSKEDRDAVIKFVDSI